MKKENKPLPIRGSLSPLCCARCRKQGTVYAAPPEGWLCETHYFMNIRRDEGKGSPDKSK